MRVDYINSDVQDDFVRCTFIGFDVKGRRRPVIDLDTNDLRDLVYIAKEFRRRQKSLARKANERGDTITQAGVALD